MRLRRVGLLSTLLMLPACGSIISWSPLGRSLGGSGAEEMGPAVPAPYSGIALDVLLLRDGTLIFLLDLPLSLVLDTAVLPLTLTIWLFRQVPRAQHDPPPLPGPTGPPRAATADRPLQVLSVGTAAVVVLTGEPQEPARFEVELTPGRGYVVEVTTAADPARPLHCGWVWVTPPRQRGACATPGPSGVRLPASGSFAVDRTERWEVEVWPAPGGGSATIQVLVRVD